MLAEEYLRLDESDKAFNVLSKAQVRLLRAAKELNDN